MSPVGVVSILLGLVAIAFRAPLVVAPRATVAWFRRLIGTSGRVRALGVPVAGFGVLMIWAGGTAESVLATVLTVLGWLVSVIAAALLLVYPPGYVRIADRIFAATEGPGGQLGWRVLGLIGVGVGVAFVYYGILAL